MSYMYFKMGTMVITKKPIMESTDEHIRRPKLSTYHHLHHCISSTSYDLVEIFKTSLI